MESGGKKNVLSLNYLGNLHYFSKLCFGECVIDIYENYQKQSYRNRCEILSPNGVTSLIVNTVGVSNWDKVSVKETRIDYSKRWQHRHWQSIVAAYGGSPFFEFFEPYLAPFYEKRYEFLLDYNLELLQLMLRLLQSDAPIVLSESYVEIEPENRGEYSDFRDSISPKPRLQKPDPTFVSQPYWQVFGEERGFVPNLSIIDLLFCKGTEALSVISSSTLQ